MEIVDNGPEPNVFALETATDDATHLAVSGPEKS